MSISLGSVTLEDAVILAPMSGVTDLPFRRLVKRHGAALVVSEMIASQAAIRETRQSLTMAQSCAEEQPMAVQLAGCEPQIMAEAAKLNADRGARLIDINFGCPVKKVVSGHAGSALMRDETARRAHPRSDGQGRRSAGHAENAHGLGRQQPQRAASGEDRRILRHPHGHGARPHTLPVLRRQRRLALHPRGQGGGFDPGHRQRRHHDARRRRAGACRIRRRRADGRARLLWPALVHRAGDRLAARSPAPAGPAARGAIRDRPRPLRRHADPLWPAAGRAHRAQASGMVFEGAARLGGIPRRRQPDRRGGARRVAAARVLRTADRAERRTPPACMETRRTPARHLPRAIARGQGGGVGGRHDHAAEAHPLRRPRAHAGADRHRAAAGRPAEPGSRARSPGHRAFRQPGGRAVFRRRRHGAGRPQVRQAAAAAQPDPRARGHDMAHRRVDRRIRRAGGKAARSAVFGDGAGRAGGGGGRPLVLMLHERSMADKMDRQLTHLNAGRSVTAMAAMLAHEVKNPLSGIRGAAQLLEQDADASGRELTQLICEETDRIVALVDRVEAFSGYAPISRGEVNIHEILDRVRKAAQSGFARHVAIREDYDPSLPPVHGDRDLLLQVFLNLVKNAAEAVPAAGGEIVLATAYRHGLRLAGPGGERRLLPLMVSVADNGSGIPDGIKAASVRSVCHDETQRNWPRSCTGGEGNRRSRRRDRVRQPTPAHGVPGVSANCRANRRGPRRECARRWRMMSATILVADDDRAIRMVLNQALARLGHDVRMTGNAATLWRWVADGEGDLVITDVVMPDENGLDLIPRIRRVRPDLRVIVMSAQTTLLTAVKAAERGAFEYLPKPFDLRELVSVVERALSAPTAAPATAEADPEDQLPLIGRSPAMQEIYRAIARLMGTDLTVMITGESGTGKELVARALHDFGKRRAGPFVAINMAAIPRELIESELFGHESGAFTGATSGGVGRFEQAKGGTLFLDEIGDMPPEAQTRLLRVLQEGEYTAVGGRTPIRVDVRIVAATHRDLRAADPQGLFREDLFYRLNVAPIRLPPLRERSSDVPALARHFASLATREGLPLRHSTKRRWNGCAGILARKCARIGKPGTPPGRAVLAGGDRARHHRGGTRSFAAPIVMPPAEPAGGEGLGRRSNATSAIISRHIGASCRPPVCTTGFCARSSVR